MDRTIHWANKIDKIDDKIDYYQNIQEHVLHFDELLDFEKYDKKVLKLKYKRKRLKRKINSALRRDDETDD